MKRIAAVPISDLNGLSPQNLGKKFHPVTALVIGCPLEYGPMKMSFESPESYSLFRELTAALHSEIIHVVRF
jgi:hypothetical protein